jgi:DNA-binding GntR family transcriptional regulator
MQIDLQLPDSKRIRLGSVANVILRGIFTGQLRGGDRLVEEELAATLGVSRTPVREALAALAAIGLVEIKANRGAVVRPFGERQLRELYHLRQLLESEAARLAAERLELVRLVAIADRMRHLLRPDVANDTDAWAEAALALDHEFHDLIAEGSGSERLAGEIARLRELADFLRETVGNTQGAQRTALTEHLDIADRLLARDPAGAADSMGGHIRRGTETAVATLLAMARRTDVTPTVMVTGDKRRNRPRRRTSPAS